MGKKHLSFLVISLIASGYLAAQEKLEIKSNVGKKYYLVEKSDLTKYTNSGYIGLLAREVRGICEVVASADTVGTSYEGIFYVLEEIKKEARPVAQKIDASYKSSFTILPSGEYLIEESNIYPTLRNFPVFPEKVLKAGDKWQAYGIRLVEPKRDGVFTRVRFYCDYEYKGKGNLNGKPCDVIQAQYALRYKRGDDPRGDEDLSQLTGKHVVTIYLDSEQKQLLFMRDSLEETYQFSDRSFITYKVFSLTWFNLILLFNKKEILVDLKEELKRQELKDITLAPRPEGLLLTVYNIHFVPDEAVVLPEELPRLKALAALLKKYPGRTILVRGHTARWGSVESQFSLSLARAKTIADYLIGQGLSPDQFIYEGKGALEPVASNDTEEGRAQNRRVEIFILEN